MEISHNYKNAFTEVYEILETLDEEDYKKIPEKLIEIIIENKNINYKYKINEKQDLTKQEMLPETRALLFNIFRDYLATPEQKNKIIKIQKGERERENIKKGRLYNPDVFSKIKNKKYKQL